MQNSTKSCRLAQQLLVAIPVLGASALREAQLGHVSALQTTVISWHCFCWCAWDAWHQPPAGSLGVLTGQQQPQEGQEDSSRTGLRARMRTVPLMCGPRPTRGQPRRQEGKQPQLWWEDKHDTIRQKALETQDAPEASRLRGAGERRGRPDSESRSVFDIKPWRELGRGRSSGCFCLERENKS